LGSYRLMKQIDLKSFAIGVLLTTTIMFGTGAATSTTEKWDANQKWEVIRTSFEKPTTREAGYEPFHSTIGNYTLWRRRID